MGRVFRLTYALLEQRFQYWKYNVQIPRHRSMGRMIARPGPGANQKFARR